MSKQLTTTLGFALAMLLLFSTQASAMYTTYQAKIIKPDGIPLEATNVNFRFTVLDPLGACILYTENFNTINMAGSGGLVNFSLGSGIKTFPVSGSVNFSDVFDNYGAALSCASGGPPSYIPAANDLRKIVMQFHDGAGWQTLPAMNINHVPYAMYAKNAASATTAINSNQLNGKTDLDFVQVSTIPTCTVSQALQFNGASFGCVSIGSGGGGSITVSGTAPIIVTGTASSPQISISVASMSSDGYLTAADYAEFKAKLSTSSTEITNTLGFMPVSAAAVATQVTAQISAAAAVSSTANALVLRDSSGNIWANDVYSNTAKTNYVDIFKPSTAFSIRLQAPTSLSASYNLIFPSDDGSNGQVLTTDGSGNLSWASQTQTITSSDVVTALGYTPVSSTALGNYLAIANNLSDLSSAAAARTNLGLGGFATINSLDLSTASATGIISDARLMTFSGVTSGTQYTKVTVDGKGRVTSGAQLAAADVATALGYTPASSTAATQWVTNGTTINYSAGNVGVGTTTPGASLDVVKSGASSYTGVNTNITSTAGNATGFDTTVNGFNYSTGVLVFAESNGAAVGVDIYAAVNSASGSYVRGIDVGIEDSLVAGSGLRLFADTGTTKASKAIEIASGFNSGYAIYANTNGKSYFKGNVGIGTTTPATKLSVSGGLQISMESATCAVSYAGTLRYTGGNIEYCNGSSWAAFGVATAGVNSLNGSASQTQTFANGTTGTAPTFSTLNGVHTLNIPLASAGSVTAGLLSNADYTTFMNKITSSAASISQVLGYAPVSTTALSSYVLKANNLSDLTSSATARMNLGLGTLATASTIDLGSASATGTLAAARMPELQGDVDSVSGSVTTTVVGLQGRSVASTAPASGQVLSYNGTSWAPATSISSQWSTSGSTINYSSGNVGIGTTGPINLLHAHASAGNTVFRMSNASTGITGSDGFVIQQTASDVNLINYETGAMAFQTSASERMRITSAGAVGVGTTNPSATLHVSGSLLVTDRIKIQGTAGLPAPQMP